MRPYALFLTTLMLLASAARAADPPTVAQIYDEQLSIAQAEIVPLVEAMPADKFGFAPTAGAFKDVRTFAQQAKHLAAVIYLISAAARGERPPIDTNGEKGPDTVKSKEQIVEFLKDAFAVWHSFDHYGQMVATPE